MTNSTPNKHSVSCIAAMATSYGHSGNATYPTSH